MADEQIRALVLLVPAHGGQLVGSAPPVASTYLQMAASPETVESASRQLRRLGFDVAPAGPVALSISGDGKLFETTFPTRDEGELVVPESLTPFVERVVFPSPAETFS